MNHIKSFIAHCCINGICEWIVCPGARNAALLQVLAASPDLVKRTHFDERGAGFFALGRIQDMGLPVAVVTTSGTAAAELLPSVIEAYYEGRPLMVITADRPAEFRGSGAPQAIEQAELFGIYAPTIDMASPEEMTVEIFENWDYASPIHINVCLPEPDLAAEIADCDLYPAEPPEITYPPQSLSDLAQALRFKSRLGLVLMIGGLDPNEQAPALWLAKELRVPVIADATSGLREELAQFNLISADRLLRKNPPKIVLRVGDVPVSRFWRDLENLPNTEVYSISRTPFSGLARESTLIQGDLEQVLESLGDIDTVGDVNDLKASHYKHLSKLEEALITYPESEQALVQAFSCFAVEADNLYLGNSLPIRRWNDFAQTMIPIENCRANRGANGIDGQIATFLGNSANAKNSWALMGDLTCLYDVNSLALVSQLPAGKRVLAVINNQGGQIFSTLPGGQEMTEELRRLLVQPHQFHMKHLAEQWGLNYLQVRDSMDMEQLDHLPKDKTCLVEIIPDPAQTQAVDQLLK